MKRTTAAFLLLLLTGVLGTRLNGQEAARDFVARLAPVSPFPALVTAAEASNIPLDRIDPRTETETINPGDSFTALVTLCKKGSPRTQWLLYLRAEAADPQAQATNSKETMVIYNTLGNKLEFVSSPTIAVLCTLGPFAESQGKVRPPKTTEKNARFALDKGWLGLGLDQAAEVFLRLKESKVKGPIASGTVPFSDAQIIAGRKLASALKLTTEEERACAGTYPALLSYFRTAQQTPGLNNILEKIVDRPSVWSLTRNLGVKTIGFSWQLERLAPADGPSWGLPTGQPVYYCPMVLVLNSHPALNLTLVVTAPHPPLLTCAGVIGVLAEKPDDKDTYLTLRIVSAHRSRIEPPHQERSQP